MLKYSQSNHLYTASTPPDDVKFELCKVDPFDRTKSIGSVFPPDVSCAPIFNPGVVTIVL